MSTDPRWAALAKRDAREHEAAHALADEILYLKHPQYGCMWAKAAPIWSVLDGWGADRHVEVVKRFRAARSPADAPAIADLFIDWLAAYVPESNEIYNPYRGEWQVVGQETAARAFAGIYARIEDFNRDSPELAPEPHEGGAARDALSAWVFGPSPLLGAEVLFLTPKGAGETADALLVTDGLFLLVVWRE